MDKVFNYLIQSIPDPGDNSLAASVGGNITQKAFTAAEQFLRIVSHLDSDMFSFTIRFIYKSKEYGQSRTQIQFEVRTELDNSYELIDKLINSGPFTSVYQIIDLQDKKIKDKVKDKKIKIYDFDYTKFNSLTEVVKQEKIYTPFIREYLQNKPDYEDKIKHIPKLYYTIHQFKVRAENEWLQVDNLLDRYKNDIVIEIRISPTDTASELKLFSDYIRGSKVKEQLKQIEIGFEQVVQDPMADEINRLHEETYENLKKPQFNYFIRCWGVNKQDTELIASSIAESCFDEGHYSLITVSKTKPIWNEIIQNINTINLGFLENRVWDIINSIEGSNPYLNFKRMSRLASPDELLSIFRLPVGKANSSHKTMRRHTDPEQNENIKNSILIGDDLELGKVKDGREFNDLEELFAGLNSSFSELRLDKELLKKHMFIAGVPGSGKTTAMNNLLTQFAHLEEPLKFLVIEPAKTEYRTFKELKCHPDPVVKNLAESLQIYTVGNEEISPFRFNPLAYPEGVSLDEHIGTVLACFEAAMPMGGPLQGLLAEAVEYVYENPPEGRKFPRLKDLLEAARKIVDSKGYEGEILGNLKAALDVRLGLLVRRSLGKVFDCDEGIPNIDGLFKENIILEMDYLTPEHACLMSLFVLSAMREYIKVNRSSGSDIIHITLLEEAHNIVGRSGNAGQSEEGPDPKAFAANYVSRMLAELRALGEGIIIADQLPTAVAPEVIKNTGAKLAHRLVSTDDREDLGAAMLLSETQIEDLARLKVGEAYFYSEGLFRPRRTRAINSSEYLALGQESKNSEGKPKFPPSPNKQKLLNILKDEKWFIESKTNRSLSDIKDLAIISKKYREDFENIENILDNAVEYNSFNKLKLIKIKKHVEKLITSEHKLEVILSEIDKINVERINKPIVLALPEKYMSEGNNILKELNEIKHHGENLKGKINYISNQFNKKLGELE